MEGDDDSEFYEDDEELSTILLAADLVTRIQAITELACYAQWCNDLFVGMTNDAEGTPKPQRRPASSRRTRVI